ncbi:hypothetical protein T4B_9244, partial [Trichinella pseudospiralis]
LVFSSRLFFFFGLYIRKTGRNTEENVTGISRDCSSLELDYRYRRGTASTIGLQKYHCKECKFGQKPFQKAVLTNLHFSIFEIYEIKCPKSFCLLNVVKSSHSSTCLPENVCKFLFHCNAYAYMDLVSIIAGRRYAV